MANGKISFVKELLKEFLPSVVGTGASYAGARYIENRGNKTIEDPAIRDNVVGALDALSMLSVGNLNRKGINAFAKTAAYKVPKDKKSEVTLRNILDQKNKGDIVKSFTKAGMTAATLAYAASGVRSNMSNHLDRLDSGDEKKGILGQEYFMDDYRRVVNPQWLNLKRSYDKDALISRMSDPNSNPTLAWSKRRDINGNPDYHKDITDYEKLTYQIGNYFADDNNHSFDQNEKNFHLNMSNFSKNDRLNFVKMLRDMSNKDAINFYNKAKENGLFDDNSLKAIDNYFIELGKYNIME